MFGYLDMEITQKEKKYIEENIDLEVPTRNQVRYGLHHVYEFQFQAFVIQLKSELGVAARDDRDILLPNLDIHI